QLEAVHFGHLHVDQCERDVVREQQVERLDAGSRREQLHVVLPEQGLQYEQILLAVVHEKTFHGRHDVVSGRVSNISVISSSVKVQSGVTRPSAASAISGTCASSGRCTIVSPPPACTAARPSAPSWLAPVSTAATTRRP